MIAAVTPDDWASGRWSHEALMDMQARLSPSDIERMAHEWKDIVAELDSAFSIFLGDVTKTMAEGWRGQGARAALQTMRDYVENSRTTFGQAQDFSKSLMRLSAATADLQENITVPPALSPIDRSGLRPGARADLLGGLESLDEAIRQVQTLYSAPAVQAGNAVREFTGPRERLRFGNGSEDRLEPSRTADDPARDEQTARAEEFLARLGLDGTGDAEPSDAEPSGPAGQMPPQATTGQTAFQAPGNAGTSQPRLSSGYPGPMPDDFAEDDLYANQRWKHDPLTRESQTRSSGLDTSPSPMGGPSGSLAPDRSPVAWTASQSTASGAAGPATRGMGAMMPMMGAFPVQPGQRRGDENEHYTPGYLVNGDNTKELLGELPKASVPVIGVWDDMDLEDRGR